MMAVEARNLTKRFGDVLAVAGVSFEVARGQSVSLLGPSGCGKTTILRLIAGFEVPDEGSVMIAGEDMRSRRPYERNVGLLFQDYALFPHMSVEENVAYGLLRRGVNRRDITMQVGEMLELVRLQGLGRRRPHQLSGGQQQRVALGRALATRPKIMLLDEPLSALDAKLREQLRVELREILLSVGSATIVVTHDQEEAMSLSENILVMRAGQIVQRGTPAEIYSSPKNRFVAEFIGRANWFDGRIESTETSGMVSFVTSDGLRLLACAPHGNRADRTGVCVRPERVAVGSGAGLAGEGRRTILSGRVMDVVRLGPDIHYWVMFGSGRRILAIEKDVGQTAVRRGDEVDVAFNAYDCVLLPAD